MGSRINLPGDSAGTAQLDARVFEGLSTIAYERAGIQLRPGKEGLLAGRIAPRLRALALASPGDYLALLLSDLEGDEVRRFVDTICTNFTSFFREPDHFELLREAAVRHVTAGQRRLRVWSAACSTGEEPYSIAFVLQEALRGRDVDIKILATDLSGKALAQARAGAYAADRLVTVPAGIRRRLFVPAGGEQGLLQVRPEVAALVHFRRLNLAAPPFPMRGPFDLVFCRNVLIYFDHQVRQRLIGAITGLLRPGGWLCIGHTETLGGLRSGLRTLRPSVFRKPDLARTSVSLRRCTLRMAAVVARSSGLLGPPMASGR